MTKKRLSFQWHITGKCNNRCRHCYMERKNNDLSFEQLSQLFSKLLDLEKTGGYLFNNITITGGDPLLHNNWLEFAQLLVDSGKKIAFLGNPETLTDDVLKKLKDLNIVFFQLSLDGLEETHDYLRSPGSFQRTIQAIKRLNTYNIPVHIMFTLSQKNEAELIPLINYLDSLQIRIAFAFDFLVPIGNAAVTKLPYSDNMDTVFSSYLDKKRELQQRNSKLYLSEKSSFFIPYKVKNGILNFNFLADMNCDICMGCGATWNHFTILNNGDVCICRRMPIKIGNLLSDSPDTLFAQNSVVDAFQDRSSYLQCGTCKYYQFCRGCPAIFQAVSGDYHGNTIECPYYEKLLDTQKTENSTPPILIGDMISNKKDMLSSPALVKAIIILGIAREREKFASDLNAWLLKHRLDLSEYQLMYLKHQIIRF